MSTTDEKGLEFIRLISQIAENVRRAHLLAGAGIDAYAALDMQTWIDGAAVDAAGNIAGTTVTKAELAQACASIVALVQFLENEAPTQGTHLVYLLRAVGIGAVVP
jgi:hypothetical protein